MFKHTIYEILRYTMLMIDYYNGSILRSNSSSKFYSFALILILNINGLGRCPYLLTVLNCKLGQNSFHHIVSDHSVTKLLISSKKDKFLCHCLSFRPNQYLTRDFFNGTLLYYTILCAVQNTLSRFSRGKNKTT